MSLTSTSKVRIYTSPDQLGDLLTFLQRKECIEVIKNKEDGKNTSFSSDSALAHLEFAIRYFSKYQPERKGIRNAVLGEKIEVSESESEKMAMTFDWKSLCEEASVLEQGRNDVLRELGEKKEIRSLLEGWGEVNLSATSGQFTSFFIEVPLQNISLFEKSLKEEISVSEREEISRNKKIVRSVIYIQRSNEPLLMTLVSQYKGNNISLPEGESPAVLLSSITSEIDVLQKKINANSIRSQELAKDIDSLKMIYDVYLSQKSLDMASSSSTHTDYTVFVDGWIPSREVKLLQYDLEKNFSSILIENLKNEEGDKAPVILSASGTMKPIQEITKIYGTPAEKELDPTSYYALFFVIFFGFCLTDAGYGLILMALTGIPLLMKLPFESTVKNVIKMFFYGGVSTFILGVLFGGYFGLTADQVPGFLTYTRDDGVLMFLGQVLNPMTDLVDKVMPLTYGLGVFHLFLGLYLSGKIAWSNGNKERMLFVVLPTYAVFLFGALSFGFGVAGMEYLFYISLAMMVWGLGKNGNPLIRILKGLGGMANEILSWFQNILSYSRLFALGLATGVIGMAFNIVAKTLGGMIPGILGIIVVVLVLIFGHVLNISLNLLGAYVHSSRLQFVEFFGLFLEGGGKTFNPLKKEVKYRHLSDS